MDKTKKKMSSLSDIFDTSTNWPLMCIQLKNNWENIVGSKWGEVSRPVSYKNQCLFVRLPSACHSQEMGFEKQMLLSKINKFIGIKKIQDIRCVF